MPEIVLETVVDAPADVCFDLMRDIRVHPEMIRSACGLPTGPPAVGQIVVFRGKVFGIRQDLTTRVVEFDRPKRFVDEMTRGTFRSFRHVHEFLPHATGTLIRDTLIWRSPFGVLGRIVDRLLLAGHLRRVVQKRNARLKAIAEALHYPTITIHAAGAC